MSYVEEQHILVIWLYLVSQFLKIMDKESSLGLAFLDINHLIEN